MLRCKPVVCLNGRVQSHQFAGEHVPLAWSSRTSNGVLHAPRGIGLERKAERRVEMLDRPDQRLGASRDKIVDDGPLCSGLGLA